MNYMRLLIGLLIIVVVFVAVFVWRSYDTVDEEGEDMCPKDETKEELTLEQSNLKQGLRRLPHMKGHRFYTDQTLDMPLSLEGGWMQLHELNSGKVLDGTEYMRIRSLPMPPSTSKGEVGAVVNRDGDEEAYVKDGVDKMAMMPLRSPVDLSGLDYLDEDLTYSRHNPWHGSDTGVSPFYSDPFMDDDYPAIPARMIDLGSDADSSGFGGRADTKNISSLLMM